ncbi:MAG TPA: N-acetyl-gamma-glutamyl-phosphate reductase [Candidatus Limivicinus faecipullorum]|nr:N-acetyl-gamma-glutamyl-phosphate reductase [Candidatus Limivicinus faecipullorum]
MTKVFIDGSAGTTGLRIHERLSARQDIQLISVPSELRKDPKAREEAINAADIAFFCLPDAAAIEAASLCHGSTALIDTSTAHRTDPAWDYGFPELKGRREKVAASKRVANPGCHASGFIALAEPLVRAGIIPAELKLSCFSLTGYSGGGKKMIAEYEDPLRNPLLSAPRQYALTQQHKHLKEMRLISALEEAPVFCPIVADYYSGMEVTVPLFRKDIKGSMEDIKEVYREYYSSGLVHFEEDDPEAGLLSGAALSGRDDMEIRVTGCDERILLISRFDNLGKGASGAAIQNMNIILGLDEKTGLTV